MTSTKPLSRSEKIKRGIRQAKADGKPVGANGKALAARNRCEALDRAQRLSHIVAEFSASGLTYRAMVDRLNRRHEPAPSGLGRWHIRTLQRLLSRTATMVEAHKLHDATLARSAAAIETARALRHTQEGLQRRAAELMARAVQLRETLIGLRLQPPEPNPR